VDNIAEGIWLTGALLQPDECAELLSLSHKNGYEKRTSPRRHNRECFIWRPDLSKQIVTRLNSKISEDKLMPFYVYDTSAVLQCYLYRRGDLVAPHYDQSNRVNHGTQSAYTLIIYLNDRFKGGATAFPELGIELSAPVGHGILFAQSLLHEGMKVMGGEKYIVRTDVATAGLEDEAATACETGRQEASRRPLAVREGD